MSGTDSLLGTGAANGGSGAISNAVSANGEVNNLFTTLLVAQIRNQNPLEPTDPSEFVGQLTQLSQMEAMQKLASQGTAQAAMLENLQTLALGGQVGNTVTVYASSVQLGTTPVSGRFHIDAASAKTALVLTGPNKTTHRIELGTRAPGTVNFAIDPAALGLPPGTYTLAVEAESGEKPATMIDGTLGSVRMGAAGVLIDVAGVGETTPDALAGFSGRAPS